MSGKALLGGGGVVLGRVVCCKRERGHGVLVMQEER
jgi:hypothetical protein